MPRRSLLPSGRLTEELVAAIARPGDYPDKRIAGFRLRVQAPRKPGGRLSKCWALRTPVDDKVRECGLGSHPAVSLAEAMEKAEAAIARWSRPRVARPAGSEPTFAQAFEAAVAQKRSRWADAKTTERRWRATMSKYVLDALGAMPVTTIATRHIVEVLRPVGEKHPETARSVRKRIASVMAWVQAEGYRDDNPGRTRNMQQLYLPSREPLPQGRLRSEYIGDLLGLIRTSSARRTTVACIEFMVLSGARVGEARLATWEEIDLNAMLWTLPEGRSVERMTRIVPLSPLAAEAVELLPRADQDATGLVFPAPDGTPVSNATFSKLFRERGIVCTPNEARNIFLQWATASTDGPEKWRVSNALSPAEASYGKEWETDLLTQRRALMDAWGEYAIGSIRHFEERLRRSPALPRARRSAAGR